MGGTWDLIASMPPQISIMIVMWFSMNFIVAITLLMRWLVRSWKLQASKIEITRSRISSLRIFCWSGEDLGQRAGRLIDRFGGFQNLLRGLFGASDHGAELAGHLGHFVAVKTLAVQNRDLPLGAVDGVVNEIEFDLEFLALLDLGAIGFKQRLRIGDPARDRRAAALCCRAVTRAGHLGTDGAQFGHDLAMHRTDVAVDGRGDRHVAVECFLDTKTLAMDRHEIFPDLHSSRF